MCNNYSVTKLYVRDQRTVKTISLSKKQRNFTILLKLVSGKKCTCTNHGLSEARQLQIRLYVVLPIHYMQLIYRKK